MWSEAVCLSTAGVLSQTVVLWFFFPLAAVQLKLKSGFDGFCGKWAGLVRPLAELGKLVCSEEPRLAK